MNKIFRIVVMIILALPSLSCIYASVNTSHLEESVYDKFISGSPVKINSLPIQTIYDSFDVSPNSGPILTQKVEIFKLDNNKCLSLVTLYNESGFGGYQSFIIFKNEKILTSLLRSLRFYAKDGIVNEEDIKYDDIIDDSKATQLILKEHFDRYKRQFNSKVNSECK